MPHRLALCDVLAESARLAVPRAMEGVCRCCSLNAVKSRTNLQCSFPHHDIVDQMEYESWTLTGRETNRRGLGLWQSPSTITGLCVRCWWFCSEHGIRVRSQSHVLFLAQHKSTLSSESRGGVLELQKGKFGNYNHIICCEHNICNFFMNRHAIHHALLLVKIVTEGTCVIMWDYRWQKGQSLLSYFLIPPLPWESLHRGRGIDKKCVTQWIHGASERAKISPFLLPSIAMAVTPEGRALQPCLCCDQPLLSWEKEIKGSIRQLSCFFFGFSTSDLWSISSINIRPSSRSHNEEAWVAAPQPSSSGMLKCLFVSFQFIVVTSFRGVMVWCFVSVGGSHNCVCRSKVCLLMCSLSHLLERSCFNMWSWSSTLAW